MTDYTLACPDCGHDASRHIDGSCADCHNGPTDPCICRAASLYAAECVRLAANCTLIGGERDELINLRGSLIAERDAARAECERLAQGLAEVRANAK